MSEPSNQIQPSNQVKAQIKAPAAGELKALGILLFLYVAQGLPFGFFTQAMPSLMREQGVDLKTIGLMSLLALPWALKFLWASLLDRYSLFNGLPAVFNTFKGHRKGWIIAMNACAVMAVLLLSMGDVFWWLESGLALLMVLVFMLNLFAATQDISTDALAVESVSEDKRGWLNGLQVSGYRLGMVLGGGLLLGWLPVLGWQMAMVLLAVMLVVSSGFILFWPKPEKPATQDSGLQSIASLLRVPNIARWVLLLVLYKAGDAFGTAMLKPMLIDHGLTLTDIAWYLGTWGVVAGLVGAIIGALLIKPLGRFRALWLFALLQTASLAGYGLLAIDWLPSTYLLHMCVMEHVTGAMATIAVFTVMMDFCRPQHAGLDYSVQSCLIIISGLVLGGMSGFSATGLGYGGHFMLASGLTLLACFYVLLSRKNVKAVVSDKLL